MPISLFLEGKRMWRSITVAVVLLGVVYIGVYIAKQRAIARPPSVLTVSVCKPRDPGTGISRLGEPSGFQFDVPTDSYIITDGTQDTPPFAHGFALKPRNSNAIMTISFGPQSVSAAAPDPGLVYSARYEKRNIFDENAQRFGEDDWGYLRPGEYWRRIHLRGSVYVKYGFANKNDANLFDQIINSGCLLTPTS